MELSNREYKVEINGLRALAVVLVLLYHLELDFISAGFLGVDVFLVISGYLITRNILKDLDGQKFSLKDFYTRRFKRLFPALFVTLALSLIAGIIILNPVNLLQLSKAIVSGVFYYSNFYFLSEVGYFDTDSSLKPLLHIWSLSLEEQFYFIWPILLLLIFNFFRKNIYVFILGLIIVSVFLANIYIVTNPEATFYLLPFRFFEFLLGALCIYLEKFNNKKNELISEIIFLTGLGLICYSTVQFNTLTPMPGTLSLIPCIGTMMVIFAGNAKKSGWILRNKVSELIGKSSYSIYLVHWPLIVFYKYYTLSELNYVSRLVLGGATLILGYLMWRYIESTFRKYVYEVKLLKVDIMWVYMPALMLILFFVSQNIWSNKGYESRFTDVISMTNEEMAANENRYWQNGDTTNKANEYINMEDMDSNSSDSSGSNTLGISDSDKNFSGGDASDENNELLVDTSGVTKEKMKAESHKYRNEFDKLGNPSTDMEDRTIIVMGNSIGIDLIYALKLNNTKARIVSLLTTHRCYNFGMKPEDEENTKFCDDLKLKNFSDPSWSKADAIYLWDHWPKLDTASLGQILIEIRSLTDAPIYVFGPKMSFSISVVDIVHQAKSKSVSEVNKYAQSFAYKEGRNKRNDALTKYFDSDRWKRNKVHFIDVLKIQGDNVDIISNRTSGFLYFDHIHFTEQGSKEFGEKLKKKYPELF